jgi:hypothetical protein
MRSFQQLVDSSDPGWPLVIEWINDGKNKVEVLPRNKESAERALYEAQVTTRSPMGAIIYESGGLLIDDGWIRVLGSGHIPSLDRSLMAWNLGKTARALGEVLSYLLIADDAVGGLFALNGGGLGTQKHELQKVFYFAPDTLEWESMDLSYSGFLEFCFSGDLDQFYSTTRWEGWRDECMQLDGDQVFSFYPFLWAEGPIESKLRKAVPITEVWSLYQTQMK